MKEFILDKARLSEFDELMAFAGSMTVRLPPCFLNRKRDARGTAEVIYLNGKKHKKVFTREGYFRGGEYHPHDKYVWVTTGTMLLVIVTENGDEKFIYLTPESERMTIYANERHYFRAITDNTLFETWNKPFRAYFCRDLRIKVKTKG